MEERDREELFSKRIRAGKRTYFFDVKSTRSQDYYITITESRRHQKEDGVVYEKHKMFLYKEDFDKFIEGLNEAVNHVKTELIDFVFLFNIIRKFFDFFIIIKFIVLS